MKKRKPVPQPAIPEKSDPQNNHSGVSRTNLMLVASVCLLVGFILGATVTILKTTKANKIAGPSEESQRKASVDHEGEIKQLKAALEKDPNDLPTLIELGNAYFDSDRYQEAIEVYLKALAVDPKNPDVRTDMGIMYRKLGQFDKAIEAFRQAAQDQPMHANSRFNLGIVLKYDKNDLKGAVQAWEEFLKLEPLLDPGDERPVMVKQEIESMKASLSKK
jgi:cytochrome c-type biogenesis protein CcmH/NrfG